MNIDRGGTLIVVNQPLRKLITYAYDVRSFQLAGGPGWVENDLYDITAKTSPDEAAGVRDADGREKIRALLAERFGLVVHRDTTVQNVYRMVVAKHGVRMRAVETPGTQRGIYWAGGHIQGFAATTEMLARELAGITGRMVIDDTNLTAMYDWTLQWATDTDDGAAAGPTILTALEEQLGLKLEPSKAAVEVIAIDHVSRPTAN
jgi:bla regulator protein blaR1